MAWTLGLAWAGETACMRGRLRQPFGCLKFAADWPSHKPRAANNVTFGVMKSHQSVSHHYMIASLE